MTRLSKVKTYSRLGLRSLIDVGLYRMGLRLGMHPVQRIQPVEIPKGLFFSDVGASNAALIPTKAWQEEHWVFGEPIGGKTDRPPHWHRNPFTGFQMHNSTERWDKVATFSNDLQDIKAIWEASRFDWCLCFAQRAAVGGETAIAKLNDWLEDWHKNNLPFQGPNWMCGQETSIRVAHLALASVILGQDIELSPTLEAMLTNHLRRIAPTTAYARGQNNNHATSEAMALYIGGTWLAHSAASDMVRNEGAFFASKGQALLEERVVSLVFDDGGFSQYSFVYHRLMLDSLSITELWRRIAKRPAFSENFYDRAKRATQWLLHFVEPKNGKTPNVGSNDGAWLLPIGPCGYEDHRPSCGLASTLFLDKTAYGTEDVVRQLLGFLRVEGKAELHCDSKDGVRVFRDSCLVTLRKGGTRITLRTGGYRFRPHQADALHMDLWRDGEALLFDAGTYSYAADGWEYFPSTAAHNTVEFDGRDQMPRLGRFLFGEWTDVNIEKVDQNSVALSYSDYQGCFHQRKVMLANPNLVVVNDRIGGDFETAILRWRLPSKKSDIENNTVRHKDLEIEITSDSIVLGTTLTDHPNSRHYLRSEITHVSETRMDSAGEVVSRIQLLDS